MRQLVIITGDVNSGKTTMVNTVCSRLDIEGYTIGGIAQTVPVPSVEKNDYLVGDLSTGIVKLLMTTKENPSWKRFGRFWIDEQVFDWANDCSRQGIRTRDVVVFDEIGPVELEGGGLTPSFRNGLLSNRLPLLIVVIRKHLLFRMTEYFGIDLPSALTISSDIPLDDQYDEIRAKLL